MFVCSEAAVGNRHRAVRSHIDRQSAFGPNLLQKAEQVTAPARPSPQQQNLGLHVLVAVRCTATDNEEGI